MMILILALLMIGIPACVVADDYSSGFELSMMAWESANWHPESRDIDITIYESESSERVVLYKDFFETIDNQRASEVIKAAQRRFRYEYRPYSDNQAERNFKADFFNEWEDR